MEWVETTGRTLEEAKDAALDQLGVDEAEAEFDVVEEAKSGLFGRVRSEARVRARVQPTTPRPKVERRDRRRTSSKDAAPKTASPKDAATTDEAPPPPDDAPAPRGRGRAAAGRARGGRGGRGDDKVEKAETPRASRAVRDDEGTDVDTDIDEATLEEQSEALRTFLDGLVEAFGLDGATEVDEVDDDTLEVRVVGDDLGLLIGPKGQTLNAVQELARTIVMKGPGRGARVRVDVGGYRERRREALERFTLQVAEQVKESGTPTSLEPMSPPDRKVVHDTVNTIEGVSTISEGEDDRRRVVILPDDEG
ncbi:MAG TPA: RNA-binding cell elongation regulator Jag/EloR [Acidimicrobiales bacterium]|nr:RNA-binding cell elongation regulator Jag/EloR [Acidimicrobiales bacterium]